MAGFLGGYAGAFAGGLLEAGFNEMNFDDAMYYAQIQGWIGGVSGAVTAGLMAGASAGVDALASSYCQNVLGTSWMRILGNNVQLSVSNGIEGISGSWLGNLINNGIAFAGATSFVNGLASQNISQNLVKLAGYNSSEGVLTAGSGGILDDKIDINAGIESMGISYTSFNKIDIVNKDPYHWLFFYGPDHKRKKVKYDHDIYGRLKEKLYIGDLYEIENPDDNSRELHYIPGPDGEAAIYTTESGSNGQMYYIHKDYLGSYQTITDESGNIAKYNGVDQVYSFDPWGRRRYADTWAYAEYFDFFMFDRGFTGHEHMDELHLINMNGRMYDPMTATFLSPDPYIQSPDNTQNFNRYGYCLNNPLKYTDPTGEKWKWSYLIPVYGQLQAAGDEINHKMGDKDWHNAAEISTFVINPFKGIAWLGSVVDAIDYGDISYMDPFKPGTKINNSNMLFGGLFAADTDKSGWGWQILSRFTFQLPMTGIGFVWSNYLNFTGRVDVEYFHGATVIYDYDYGNGGAISLGGYISMDRFEYAFGIQTNTQRISDFNNAMLMHEYGHFLQVRQWGGLAFLPGGLFSLASTLGLRSTVGHNEIWIEQDANARAWAYFGDRMLVDARNAFITGRYSNRRYYDQRFLRNLNYSYFLTNLIYDIIWSN